MDFTQDAPGEVARLLEGGREREGPSLVTPSHGYVRMFGLPHRMHFGDFVGVVWVGVKE